MFQKFRERLADRQQARNKGQATASEIFQGREMLVHVPTTLPESGKRALVVVLHGGLGNASHIHDILNMDPVADHDGFIVVYLNGSRASAKLGERFRAWNAGGGCCGQPSEQAVDDAGYIRAAVAYLAGRYGIDRTKVFGVGHSNGAMMTQRLMCEGGLYRAAMPVSGPLQLDVTSCPAASGESILAVHGAVDENVPIAGGRGTKGFSGVDFRSQQVSREVFETSGASYRLLVVQGADHSLATVDSLLAGSTGKSLAQTAAEFFNLQ
jgi:polyhydroxybutyrate depolymerase